MTKRNLARTVGTAICLTLAFGAIDAAMAQTRAAVTRDVDNRDLAPVRIRLQVNLARTDLSKEVDAFTVPAGKRLIVDQASIWTIANSASDTISGIWLQVKDQLQFTMIGPTDGEFRRLCGGACNIAAYNRPLATTFEAGEIVHVYVFVEGFNDTKQTNIYLQGHYVTP